MRVSFGLRSLYLERKKERKVHVSCFLKILYEIFLI